MPFVAENKFFKCTEPLYRKTKLWLPKKRQDILWLSVQLWANEEGLWTLEVVLFCCRSFMFFDLRKLFCLLVDTKFLC